MDYLNFDLEISPNTGSFYPVAARSEAGEVRHQMLFPLEGQALENALLQVQNALLRAGNVRRGAGTIEEQIVERFGQMLFEALVGPSVRRLYDTSIGWASQQGKGVRVRLNILAPELATLPWEFLYDPAQREYLCFLPYLALVRYVEIERTPRPLQVKLPLRILAMMAEPVNQPQLDAAAERQRLEQALAPLAQMGLVELDWITGQTADDLHQKLLQREWHIFHFIGHGAFDPRHQEGVLALVDKQGQMDLRSATNLGRVLAQNRTLRLVVPCARSMIVT